MKKNRSLANFNSGMLGIIIALVSLFLSTRMGVPEDSGFFDLTAAFFPRIISVFIMIFGIYLMVANMPTKQQIRNIFEIDMRGSLKRITSNRKVWLGLAVIVYIYILPIVGYIISTSLLLIFTVILFSYNTKIKWLIFIPFVIFFPLIIYYSFNNLMLIPLP